MYDTLLFLHVLAAFMVGAAVVITSALVLGAPLTRATTKVADRLWDVGGLGTLVLGIWLALYVDGYELWDGWILAAIVLWVLATVAAMRARTVARRRATDDGAAGADMPLRPDPLMHWVGAAVTVALLADMIFKPGAGT